MTTPAKRRSRGTEVVDAPVDADLLRELAPGVLRVLVRRGADFATAEDAVQDAMIRALVAWADVAPTDPEGWLVTTAWRAFIDRVRSDGARRIREARFQDQSPPGPSEEVDDTLRLFVLCAHPSLSTSSAVALTLRAVGGLTTKQIAEAYVVPEATMAQRISRAKRVVSRVDLGESGNVLQLTAVMHTLYLVFNEGYSGDIDLAAEAIRLTRQLSTTIDEPEVHGLLALMLLHHARRPARHGADGRLIPLRDQDRELWDRPAIAEGVDILQAALTHDRLGPYQAQAAIAALHADAPRFAETDWVQIVEWYDELVALTDTPVVRLNRAVAIGEADGAPAGLAELASIDHATRRWTAVAAHLRERNGELDAAAELHRQAARDAPNLLERDHQVRQASRVNSLLRPPH